MRRQVRSFANKIGDIDREIERLEKIATMLNWRELVKSDLYLFTTEVMGFKELYEPLHRPICDEIGDETGGACGLREA